MKFIEYLIPVFIILILFEIGYNYWNKKNYYSLPDSLSSMSLGIISRLTDLFILGFMYQIYLYLMGSYTISIWTSIPPFIFYPSQISNFSIDISLEILWIWIMFSWSFLFLTLDFLFYWNHRFSHEINILWASHVTHHSSEEYNLTVALRQSFLRNGIALIFYSMFALLSVPWHIMLLVDATNRLYQFWVHTRFIKKLPAWFEFVFVTPSHHRVHHARNPEYLDKNYAGVFIFWDRLFGSFKNEENEPLYGIVKPLNSFNPIRANLHTFYGILQELIQEKSWKKALVSVFGRPGALILNQESNYKQNKERSSIDAKSDIHAESLSKSNSGAIIISDSISKPQAPNFTQSFPLVIASMIFIVLIILSLITIRTSNNYNTLKLGFIYLSLLIGYGVLGYYLDRNFSKNQI